MYKKGLQTLEGNSTKDVFVSLNSHFHPLLWYTLFRMEILDAWEFRGLNFKSLRFQMLVSSNASFRILESLEA